MNFELLLLRYIKHVPYASASYDMAPKPAHRSFLLIEGKYKTHALANFQAFT